MATREKFFTYLAIVSTSVIFSLNPLTYGLIESTDWWTKWLWRGFLLALDGYLLVIIATSVCYIAGISRHYRLVSLVLLVGLLPFLFAIELGLNRYKFEVVQSELTSNSENELFVRDELVGWLPRKNSSLRVQRPDGKEITYNIDNNGARTARKNTQPERPCISTEIRCSGVSS